MTGWWSLPSTYLGECVELDIWVCLTLTPLDVLLVADGTADERLTQAWIPKTF
jgi:hypothetical protein